MAPASAAVANRAAEPSGHSSQLSILNSQSIKLFSESPTRFLLEVRADDAGAFERALAGLPLARVGVVTGEPALVVRAAGAELLRVDIGDLRAAWQGSGREARRTTTDANPG
jgi:phosphoribosylformylglycinamidine synthase